ncbi:serine hydrolase domain-containing protein [Dactylosporangium matsuzakiense]|uniref:Beta-lactamase-related domain-containing protein n=1 Tax=Dactylosporangium matsuzakiense TaxID=53360 RepID=A0A9W6KQK1_9ACTN|nr:serine hydrolase domain-containing protein [Dactylosporangium matsuzakiense]UWZ47877.1 beta-lactamase family protein [Dactylosporangium matsuzakiense]GLL05738.1 hypothetical protein GCM10017581_074850 [Dactylosporangium matsuzakiense]
MTDRPYDAALRWISAAVDDGRLDRGVFGVATSRGTVLLEPFGRGTSADEHFAVFSVTKPVVGLIALRLVEQGLLSLRQPLREVLPGFGPGRTDEVTLRHLLTHTSGVLDGKVDPPGGLRQALIDAPAVFRAGTAVQYSSLAFEGIAAMIEHASGRTVDEHLAELPGGDAMTFDPGCPAVAVTEIDRFVADYASFRRTRHPGAGLLARADGLLRLGSSLLRGDGAAVHPVTLAAMTTPQSTGLPILSVDPMFGEQDWGLTWTLRDRSTTLLERRVYGHGGWSGCQWWLYPDHDACVVLLVNNLYPGVPGVQLDNLLNAFTTGLPMRQ